MKSIQSLPIMIAIPLFLSACADTVSNTRWETPKFEAVPEVRIKETPEIAKKDFERIIENARGENNTFDPRVDILFVVDNSASMEVHQRNLRKNIDQFVNSIAKTKVIDFQIGVTTVYDSTRYGSEVKKECNGIQNYLENGELTALKGIAAPVEEKFVNRREGFASVLEQTLNVGVIEFKNTKDGHPCSTGPEIEEVFSPIIESFSETNLSQRNKGFWRDGSLKVIMMVTDAEDSSKTLNAVSVYEKLYQWTESTPEDQKFHIYAVAPQPGQRVDSRGYVNGSSTCRLDFGFQSLADDGKTKIWPKNVPNHNIAELVNLAQGDLLSICDSNYGKKLAEVGEKIRVAALKDIVFNLKRLPDTTPGRDIRVWFHQNDVTSVSLVKGTDWIYDAQRNKVIVKGVNMDWDKYPDAYISVDYFAFDVTDPNNNVVQ
ncbi:hypothetical protein GW916_08405 [bacterium]|nr:hypothetical protein [bacterium]